VEPVWVDVLQNRYFVVYLFSLTILEAQAIELEREDLRKLVKPVNFLSTSVLSFACFKALNPVLALLLPNSKHVILVRHIEQNVAELVVVLFRLLLIVFVNVCDHRFSLAEENLIDPVFDSEVFFCFFHLDI